MNCDSGKIKFKSEKSARKYLIRARERGLDLRNIYLCEWCGHYHTTSKGELDSVVKAFYVKAKHVSDKNKNVAHNYRHTLNQVAQRNFNNLPWWKKFFLRLKGKANL